MKIAYVYDAVYPWIKGGAEKRIYEISKRLVERGHEVHIFGMKHWNGEEVIMRDGVYLHGFCEPKDLYVEGRRSIKEAIYFARKVLFPLLKGDFDIIDCQAFPYFPSFSAKICSSMKRIPLVITWLEVWDDYWYEYLGKKGIFGKVVERMTTHLTNKNIAISERTKRDLEKIAVKKEVTAIPMGIDFGKIERIRATNEKSDVIFAGRLIKEKNVDVLIKAVELVKKEILDVKCMIIGDGPEKCKLEKLVYDLGLESNIKFTGFLENWEVISYMKSSKVFVLPSTREGFGMVSLEANICGLPVITVNHKMNAACDFINNDRNGFICELSEEEITEKIFMALDRRENMKRKCVESARGYDWGDVVNLTESFYLETIQLR